MSGKVSAQLNAAIESFFENAPDIAGHIGNTDNPHATTAEQVGLGNVTNNAQATKAEFTAHANNSSNPHSVTKTQVGLSNVTNDKQATETQLLTHTANATNPHSVTKAQVGLSNVTNDKQATEANLNAHTANVNNPHAVTKSQAGLSNVDNIQQASKSEYNSHVAGTADKHSATDIIYDELHNVKEYVDQLALESGTGTMDHSLLQNRDLTNAHPISAITGLSQAIGYEKYTFLGTTEDSTQTELFTTDTGTYIDENGRIKVPSSDTALAIEMKLIYGDQQGSLDRFSHSLYVTQTAIANRIAGTVVDLKTSDPIIAGSGLEATAFSLSANHAETVMGDGSLSLKVVGVESELWWKAIFTITPMLFSEF